MEQVKCPHCGKDIDSDSFFCDQCGTELLKCPKCGSLRKGKYCPACGVPTQPAKDFAGAGAPASTPNPAPTPAPNPPVAPNPPIAPNPPVAPNPPITPTPRPTTDPGSYVGTSIPGATPTAVQGPQRMTCRAIGISLPLMPGAHIGRAIGPYTQQLAGCQYISGKHARIDFDGTRWTITDIGSRNGTAVNGFPCQVNVPVAISKGDTIRFATFYDFLIE